MIRPRPAAGVVVAFTLGRSGFVRLAVAGQLSPRWDKPSGSGRCAAIRSIIGATAQFYLPDGGTSDNAVNAAFHFFPDSRSRMLTKTVASWVRDADSCQILQALTLAGVFP